jgi:hypothetical protein
MHIPWQRASFYIFIVMSCKKKKIENTLFDVIFGLYLYDAKNDEEKSMKRFVNCRPINIVMKSIDSSLYQKKSERLM